MKQPDTVTAKFPKGVPMTVEEVAAVVGPEFQEMNENPPPAVIKVREEMEATSKSARERLTWGRAAMDGGGLYGYPKGIQRFAESATRKLARTALRVAKRAFNKDPDVVAFLQAHAKREHSKSARVLLAAMQEVGPRLASVRTHSETETHWESGPSWNDIKSDVVLARAYAHYVFGLLHDEIPGSAQLVRMSEKTLSQHQFNQWGVSLFSWPAAKKIYDDLVTKHGVESRVKEFSLRSAATIEYGLYGFRSKTADLGLESCKEIRTAAGRITADLHRRKADLHDKLTGFWKHHSKQSKCAYSGLLMSCYPDATMRLATRGITGAILSNTNRFVHSSDTIRALSGFILEPSALPSEIAPFRQHVFAKAAAAGIPISDVHFKFLRYKNVHVASLVNADGRTRDVDGVAVVAARIQSREVDRAEIGFTGIYEPGPLVTVLASGDFLEWEE